MARDDAGQRARIREAIVDYIGRHPLAADTEEGILERWLPRRGFEEAPEHIARVLEELVAERMLEAWPLPGAKVLFSAAMQDPGEAGWSPPAGR